MFSNKLILAGLLILGSSMIAMEPTDIAMHESTKQIARTACEWRFLYSVAMDDHVAVRDILRFSDIDANTLTNPERKTAFEIALDKDFPLVVRELLGIGKVKADEEDLAKAITYGSYNVARELIFSGVDVNARTKWTGGDTALTHILRHADCKKQKVLDLIVIAIEHGAKIDLTNAKDITPYEIAYSIMIAKGKVNKLLLSILAVKEQCPICFELIENDIAITICKHKFHKSCLSKWVNTNNSCPTCRQNF